MLEQSLEMSFLKTKKTINFEMEKLLFIENFHYKNTTLPGSN
jgi:hypothetical protein